jgi:hypothetical protein
MTHVPKLRILAVAAGMLLALGAVASAHGDG